MSKFVGLMKQLSKDEDGAALIEYSILLGVIAVVCVTAAVAIGNWIGPKWTSLCQALPGAVNCT